MAEDSDNALLPRIGGGGGLPAPVLVNPLAAQNAGIQSAKGLWDIREKQAQEAWGNILQQSTDENGNVDYPKAQKLAAGNQMATMGMMSALKDTSGLRGAQITQSGALHSLVGNMAASLMNDPSDANLDKIDAAAAAAGLPATARAEIARIRALPPEQRGAEAYKHVVGNLTALEQLTRGGYPTPVSKDVGGAEVPTVTTPGSPYGPPRTTVGQGGVTLGLTPAQLDATVTYTDANNQPQHTTLREYLKILGTPAQPGGAQVGAPGGAGGPPPIPGTGRYTPPPPALVGPGTTAPSAATPAPAPAPAAPGGAPGGYTGGGFGGVLAPGATPGPQSMNLPPGASPALAAIEAGRLQAATGTPASAMPMVAGPGAGPTAQPLRPIEPGWGATGGMAPAGDPTAVPPPPALGATPRPAVVVPPAVPAASGKSIPGPDPRQVAGQKSDQDLFIADRTALPQRQTQEQNLTHAYEALKLVTTGKGTENASSLRNLLATVGWLPKGAVDDEAIYEIGRKYLERTIADVGNAGGTDSARALAAASNPNTGLINQANLAFLRNDLGKVRQQMAAYFTAPDKTIGAGYGEHAAKNASNTDYRGFVWDNYSQKEQQEIEKSVGKPGTPAHDALARAIGMGRSFWPTKGPVSPVPHSQASPPASSGALAMIPPPQRNALSAYA